MQKTKRLLAIEKIIAEENISSQEELAEKTERERDKLYAGYAVPQFKAAWVSAGFLTEQEATSMHYLTTGRNPAGSPGLKLNIVPVITRY